MRSGWSQSRPGAATDSLRQHVETEESGSNNNEAQFVTLLSCQVEQVPTTSKLEGTAS